jgi:hypothetical protein
MVLSLTRSLTKELGVGTGSLLVSELSIKQREGGALVKHDKARESESKRAREQAVSI